MGSAASIWLFPPHGPNQDSGRGPVFDAGRRRAVCGPSSSTTTWAVLCAPNAAPIGSLSSVVFEHTVRVHIAALNSSDRVAS